MRRTPATLAPLLLALALALPGRAGALESEELALGMTELDAISVFTRYRSCSNVVLEESPGGLAWAAILGDREVRVELALSDGLVSGIVFRYPLAAAEGDGSVLFDQLVAGWRSLSGLPARESEGGAARSGGGVAWTAGGVEYSVERDLSAARREVRVAISR